MIRLKDIAKQANVSVMTVSKALRDKPDIASTTRARIRAIADQVGYVPNHAARGLRTRSTSQFALIISALTNPLYTRVIMAIEEQSHEMGYEILFAQTLNNPEREERVIRRMLARQVDGLFIRPVYRPDNTALIYDELRQYGTPTVIVGHRALFCSEFPNVQTDDLAASRLATQHLLDLGHQRISCFTGPTFSPWAQERYEGYRRALMDANLEADEKLIFWKGNYLHVIREWMNPKFTPEKKERKYVSKNQGILGEIRNFMDEGVKQRKIVDAQIAYKKRIMEMQKKKAEGQKKTQEAAMAEGNKKIEQ